MTMQTATKRAMANRQVCFTGQNSIFSPELVTSLNVTSIYMKAWFRSSVLAAQEDCLSRVVCEAETESKSIKSPIAEVLSEVLR